MKHNLVRTAMPLLIVAAGVAVMLAFTVQRARRAVPAEKDTLKRELQRDERLPRNSAEHFARFRSSGLSAA